MCLTDNLRFTTLFVLAALFFTAGILTLTIDASAMISDFTRNSLVFDEDFETYSGWTTIGSGQVIQVSDPGNAISGDNVARKTGNNDPNGVIKSLNTPVDDFETVLHLKKVNTSGGSAMRYSIVQDIAGNGYGFYVNSGSIIVEKRTGFTASELDRTSGGWDLGEWNTFRFIKTGSSLTLEFYKNQIVDSSNIDNIPPTATVSVTDTTFSGGFNYIAINGGHDFDTDDYRVWELTKSLSQLDWNLLVNIPQVIQDIIDDKFTLPWDMITGKPDTFPVKTYTKQMQIDLTSGEKTSNVIMCNDGDVATGGGVEVGLANHFIEYSKPFPDTEGSTPIGWQVSSSNKNTTTERQIVYVVCAVPNLLLVDEKEPSNGTFSAYRVYGPVVDIVPGAHAHDATSIGTCDDDDIAISGGMSTPQPGTVFLSSSNQEDLSKWRVIFGLKQGETDTRQARAVVMCLDLEPLRP